MTGGNLSFVSSQLTNNEAVRPRIRGARNVATALSHAALPHSSALFSHAEDCRAPFTPMTRRELTCSVSRCVHVLYVMWDVARPPGHGGISAQLVRDCWLFCGASMCSCDVCCPCTAWVGHAEARGTVECRVVVATVYSSAARPRLYVYYIVRPAVQCRTVQCRAMQNDAENSK